MIALEIIRGFFRKEVHSEELRKRMADLDREKRELRYDQRRLEKSRAEAFERTRRARMRSDQTEVMYHLQDLKGLDTENRLLLRDITRINKALILLGHYARRVERLERGRDATGLATFIERFRSGKAMAGLEEAEMSEEALQELLDEELGELDRDLGLDMGEQMDQRSRELLDAVDAMIDAERSGDADAVKRIRERLELAPELVDEDAAERTQVHLDEAQAGAGAGGATSPPPPSVAPPDPKRAPKG